MTSVFLRNTRWRHGRSRGETKYTLYACKTRLEQVHMHCWLSRTGPLLYTDCSRMDSPTKLEQCHQTGRQYGIKNKAAIDLPCKLNGKLIAALLYTVWSRTDSPNKSCLYLTQHICYILHDSSIHIKLIPCQNLCQKTVRTITNINILYSSNSAQRRQCVFQWQTATDILFCSYRYTHPSKRSPRQFTVPIETRTDISVQSIDK